VICERTLCRSRWDALWTQVLRLRGKSFSQHVLLKFRVTTFCTLPAVLDYTRWKILQWGTGCKSCYFCPGQGLVRRRATFSLSNIYTTSIYRLDSAVGIATGYGLEGRGVGVQVPLRSRIVSSLCRQNRLWCQTSLLFSEYRRFTGLQTVQRSRKLWSHIDSPIRLNRVVFN
jgi:hypothetical protein